jgi:hypothetical protein
MSIIEKHGYHEYELYAKNKDTVNEEWSYVIYTEGCKPYYDGHIDSEEWYETEQEARFAAVGHISLLENGGG